MRRSPLTKWKETSVWIWKVAELYGGGIGLIQFIYEHVIAMSKHEYSTQVIAHKFVAWLASGLQNVLFVLFHFHEFLMNPNVNANYHNNPQLHPD